MATEIVMPALGVAQETGRVVQWLAAEGETVTAGEPLLEIETDKVTVSIDAPASGVLSAVRAGDGDEVSVGKVIAFILRRGRNRPSRRRSRLPKAARPSGSQRGRPTPAVSRPRTVPRRARPDPAAAGRHHRSRAVGPGRPGSIWSGSTERVRAAP